MFRCVFVRREFYDYFEDLLSQKEKQKINVHLQRCSRCKQAYEDFKTVINLASEAEAPQPRQNFWHNFKVELDCKLNERLVGPAVLKPVFVKRSVFAFATAVAIIVIAGLLTTNVFLQSRQAAFVKTEDEIVEEVDMLEELTGEIVLNHDIGVYFEELELLYELDQNLV